jgi:hypothetical protein
MKKNIQFNKKALTLNKETVAKLNDEQLMNIAGGKYGVNKPQDESMNNVSCWSMTCNTYTRTAAN